MNSAEIHTAKACSLLDFGKSIDTRCPTDEIRYIDQHRIDQVIGCHFKTGSNKSLSKRLIERSRALNIELPLKLKLEKVRDILPNHSAFKIVRLPEYFSLLFLLQNFLHVTS